MTREYPARIIRLALRNVRVRGKRYDVFVDAAGRRMVRQPDTTGPR